jgi:hypothetical protein
MAAIEEAPLGHQPRPGRAYGDVRKPPLTIKLLEAFQMPHPPHTDPQKAPETCQLLLR